MVFFCVMWLQFVQFSISVCIFAVIQLEKSPEADAACNNPRGAPCHDSTAPPSASVLQEVERGVLEEIQDMEDRVCGASLQVKVSGCIYRSNSVAKFKMGQGQWL